MNEDGSCDVCDHGLRPCTCKYSEDAKKDECHHEWRERGDERTANFSVTCIHCGANGLI